MIRTLTTWLLGLVLFLMAVTYKTHRDEAQDRKIEEQRIMILELRNTVDRQTLTLNGENQDVNIMLVTPFELKNFNGLEAKK